MPSRSHLDKVGRRQKKRWSEESMERALAEVRSGRCTVRQAAKTFSVPKSSLGDRASGRVTPGCRSGPAHLLTAGDEEQLVDAALHVAKHGFPLTKRQLVHFASSVYRRQHRRVAFSKLGQTWWLNFRRRQEKTLSVQPAESAARGRAVCVRKEAVERFYRLLSSVLHSGGVRDKPRQIFNCSEMTFQLGRRRQTLPKPGVALKSTSGFRDSVSVLACFSAAGEDVPPFLIFSKAYPSGVSYKSQGPPGALYGCSESGCVTSELFRRWFLKHFLPHAPKERPLLLLFDGHKAPVSLEVVEAARREEVTLLCLPPHCSHLLQPLDVGIFVLLRQRFAALLGSAATTDVHFNVSKKEFSCVFKSTYHIAKEEDGKRIVKEGFQGCGIYPLPKHYADRHLADTDSNHTGVDTDTGHTDTLGNFPDRDTNHPGIDTELPNAGTNHPDALGNLADTGSELRDTLENLTERGSELSNPDREALGTVRHLQDTLRNLTDSVSELRNPDRHRTHTDSELLNTDGEALGTVGHLPDRDGALPDPGTALIDTHRDLPSVRDLSSVSDLPSVRNLSSVSDLPSVRDLPSVPELPLSVHDLVTESDMLSVSPHEEVVGSSP